MLTELQSIFNIAEKTHSPLKPGRMGSLISKMGFGSSSSGRSSSATRDRSNVSAEDRQWYICGMWLPKSEVFDPGFQALKNGARFIDVSKVRY